MSKWISRGDIITWRNEPHVHIVISSRLERSTVLHKPYLSVTTLSTQGVMNYYAICTNEKNSEWKRVVL